MYRVSPTNRNSRIAQSAQRAGNSNVWPQIAAANGAKLFLEYVPQIYRVSGARTRGRVSDAIIEARNHICLCTNTRGVWIPGGYLKRRSST